MLWKPAVSGLLPHVAPDDLRDAMRESEPADFKTFRQGLFGLDKLDDIDRTVKTLEDALNAL